MNQIIFIFLSNYPKIFEDDKNRCKIKYNSTRNFF